MWVCVCDEKKGATITVTKNDDYDAQYFLIGA